MAHRFKSCDNSLCPIDGGIISPGQEAVHTDQGTFHQRCLPDSARAEYASALAQRVVAESRARRAALARQLAAADARLAAVLSRRPASPTAPPPG